MKLKYLLSFLWLLTFSLFSITALGAADVEYVFEKNFTTLAPVFMAGHEGDPIWIEGFDVAGKIYLNGAKVGTVIGEVRLWTPPMDLSNAYGQLGMVFTNSIAGVGTFEVHAQGVSLSSSDPLSGHVTLSWSGTIANGTGYFEDHYGVSAGTVTANVLPPAPTASGSETILIRDGF